MEKIINIFTKTYTRRLLLQLIIASIVWYIGNELENYYNDNNLTSYAAKWPIILFFIGGFLGVTLVFLIIEYVQHILTVSNKDYVPEALNDWDKQSNNQSNYEIDYIGPRISSIILLIPVVFVSFFAVIYGVLYGLECFLASFGIGDDPYVLDLEFRLFMDLIK